MTDLSDANSEKLSRIPTKDSPTIEGCETSSNKSNNNLNNKNERRSGRSRKVGSNNNNNNKQDDISLESRVVHLSEENLLLKKHLRKQEEKIKLLATKLVRLVGERKTKEKRDEILIEEQKTRISELELQVGNLRDKLQVSRQQLASYTKLIPHNLHSTSSRSQHSTVGAPVSKSSLSKHKKSSSVGLGEGSSSGRRAQSQSSARPSTTGGLISGGLILDHEFTTRVEQLLLEAKAENQALEDQLKVTRERLGSSEREVERVRQKIKETEIVHQEELLRLKGQIDVEHDRHKKKKLVSDNIQLIRLQRESRRTSSWLSTMETQCRSLESSLSTATETVSQLEGQVTSLQDELRDEQQKGLAFQKNLEDNEGQLSRMKELDAQLEAVLEENGILKQTNESLVNKSLSNAERSSRGSDNHLLEEENRELKYQIQQLESNLRAELKGKANLMGALSQEKMKSTQLEESLCNLNQRVDQLVSQLEQDQHQRDSAKELSLLDQRVAKGQEQEVIKKLQEEWEQELAQTQWQLLQVRDELNITKNLLRTQMTINKECQREIESLTQKLDKAETFHHEKLQEFMQIMEQRAHQMNLLEKTLESIHLNNTTRVQVIKEDNYEGDFTLTEQNNTKNVNLLSVQME